MPEDYWSLTIGEIVMKLESARKRERQEWERTAFLGTLIINFSERCKSPVNIDDLLAPEGSSKPQKRLSKRSLQELISNMGQPGQGREVKKREHNRQNDGSHRGRHKRL